MVELVSASSAAAVVQAECCSVGGERGFETLATFCPRMGFSGDAGRSWRGLWQFGRGLVWVGLGEVATVFGVVAALTHFLGTSMPWCDFHLMSEGVKPVCNSPIPLLQSHRHAPA